MTISKNKPWPFGKNKFYNTSKGKKEYGYNFLFPTICTSSPKNLNWDMSLSTIFFGWGRYYLQINICEITRDNSDDVLKEDALKIITMIKECNLVVDDMPAYINFLKKNKYIVSIAKNSSLKHPYIRSVILSSIQQQPFISEKEQPSQE
jgi:hypothetical protein